MGIMDGYGDAPEVFLNAGQGAAEIGAVAVEFVHHKGARQLEFLGEGPDLFGLYFHPGHAIHHDQCGIGGHQGSARVIDKDVVTGSIQKIDLGFFPFGHGDGSRDRDFALRFPLRQNR